MLVANGAGRKRAAAAVDSAVASFAADAIVSTGYCGALAPELSVADIVCGTSVTDRAQRFTLSQPQEARGITKAVLCRSIMWRRRPRRRVAYVLVVASPWKWKLREWRFARRRTESRSTASV